MCGGMAEPALPSLAALARDRDPDRFLCALFAPAAKREALFALILFNDELARAREVARNPMAALIRLQWWRDAIEAARQGRPPLRHEVAGPLAVAIAEAALDADDLLAMVDAREAETEEEGIATQAAFESYLRASAGGFAVAAGRLLAGAGAHLAALQALGGFYGLAGVLRSVAARAAQGHCLLPAKTLAEAGIDAVSVLRDPRDARLGRLVARLAAEGQERLAQLPWEAIPAAAIAAALPAVLARRDLARLARGRDAGGPRGLGDRLAVVFAGLRGKP